jgi:hypothetical protein
VVGVVGDVKQLSLAGDVPDAVYTTFAHWRFDEYVTSLVVRGAVDAEALVPAVREGIWSVDREQTVVRVATMESLVADTAAERVRDQRIEVRSTCRDALGFSALSVRVRRDLACGGCGLSRCGLGDHGGSP